MSQQQQSPVKGSCYRCKKPGHWANSCPDSPSTRSPVSKPVVNSDNEFPPHQCRCGAGLCNILVSNSKANPGKKYYQCPGKKEMACGFFKFCEDQMKIGVREVRPKRYPMCGGCGAGICSVHVEKNGIHAGRTYFACFLEQGDGACHFRRWQDEDNSPESTPITSENPLADHNPMFDEDDLSPEAVMEIDVLEAAACKTPPKKELVNVESKDLTGVCGQPMGSLESRPHPIVNFSTPEVHPAVPRSAVNSPFNCSFPNLDPVPENLPPFDAQSRVGNLSNPPSPLKHILNEGGIMTSAIFPAFEKVALEIQDNLITLLESTSPQNSDRMTKEADSTFSALDLLQVNYSQFRLKVNEYIKQAVSLAHIEQFINGNTSTQEIINRRNNEQQRYEELLKCHQEAEDAFLASTNMLSLLCGKASCLDSSGELIKELSNWEVDNAGRWETLLNKFAKATAECQKSLQVASQKAEEAEEAENMEIEWSAAKVAFQTAKAQLRK